MPVALDRTLYPTLAAYVKGLPGGLLAHPEAKANTNYPLGLRRSAPGLVTAPTLPEDIRVRLGAPWQPNSWIPCTTAVMMSLLLRDHLCKDEAAYADVIFERCRQVFNQPLYRALMFVLSPSLVLMGSAKRWNNFYTHSTLAPTKIKQNHALLTLTFPEGLFPVPWLMANGISYCAAITCAGAKDAKSTLKDVTATQCIFEITWR